MNALHLSRAVLCVQCESVSDCNKESCPVCGSASLMNLARVLNGQAREMSLEELERMWML